MKKIIPPLIAAAMALTASLRANTITPSFVGFAPGVAITYNADLTSGEIRPGDGFTIFDIGGFNGTILAPLDWSGAVTVGSPFGAPGGDSGLPNVTFTYTGAAFESLGRFDWVGFTIGTDSMFLSVDSWVSRDSTIGTIGTLDGSPSFAGASIVVPRTVPEGGTTAMLLGLGLVGLAVGRRFKASKA